MQSMVILALGPIIMVARFKQPLSNYYGINEKNS